MTAPALHICRERDVGLFSLIQQVIANIPWALQEGRIPIADFGQRTCYWAPGGYREKDTVWEYYFEPIVRAYPAAAIPERVRAVVERRFPDQFDPGYFADEQTYVTSQYGDHPSLHGSALLIPYATANPDHGLRRRASEIIHAFVRPRRYLEQKAQAFFDEHMRGHEVIGVHIRGTDAVSDRERREYRQGSLHLPSFLAELARLIEGRPRAKILVATDAEGSVHALRDAFGDRVISYGALRHQGGEPAGQGPTGCIMPAYIARDRDVAARNGEDAVVEYLLLARCQHLVHNGASLAVTVLLKEPLLPDTNTHRHA